jgi:penicillin-binding protein-related factor A (putative recombinase)
MKNEIKVQKEILNYLKKMGVFCWRVNNIGIPDPRCKGGWRKQNGYNMLGMSDIIGIYNGKFLAIEVKAPGRIKNVSENQTIFLENVKKYGGISIIVDSCEKVVEELKKYD